ncbi:hypothetical protein D3C87_1627490 [compost metagenome]
MWQYLRRIMVAGDKTPQFLVLEQRNGQRRTHTHIFEILDVHGRYAAEDRKAKIERMVPLLRRIVDREQRNGRIADVRDHSQRIPDI